MQHNQAICGALIELSRGLQLTVLAEGAETHAEVDYLAQRGCGLFQGDYFSALCRRRNSSASSRCPCVIR